MGKNGTFCTQAFRRVKVAAPLIGPHFHKEERRAAVQPDVEKFLYYLRQEFVTRCRRNPSYSIRSYAKSLAIDASTLAKILKGKRKIGRKTVLRLVTKLELTETVKSEIFSPQSSDTSYQKLSRDALRVASDWYHYAILELLLLPGFQDDPEWIARQLEITPKNVKKALRRLERLGMIERTCEGWRDLTSGSTSGLPEPTTEECYLRPQRQLLRRAIAALDQVSLENRDHTSMMMAVDSRRVDGAKSMIKEFRRSLAAYLREGKSFDQVYNLNVCLFPLTPLASETTLRGHNAKM